MSFEHFLQISYLIFGGYFAGKERIKDIVEFCITLPNFSEEEFRKVFNKLSINQNDFIKNYNLKRSGNLDFEYYEFNPLQIYPIYSLNEEEFIVPSYYEFIFRMVDGVYFDLFNKYKDEKVTKNNPFNEDLGYVFEEYVQTQYKITGRFWKPEFDYASGKKFSDFSILEGDDLTLIELKTKRLRLPSRNQGLTQKFDK